MCRYTVFFRQEDVNSYKSGLEGRSGGQEQILLELEMLRKEEVPQDESKCALDGREALQQEAAAHQQELDKAFVTCVSHVREPPFGL